MHHGQTRGETKNRKSIFIYKTGKFYEIRGKFEEIGGNNNFPEIG